MFNVGWIIVCSETVLITACAGGAGLACLDLAVNVFGAKVSLSVIPTAG